MQGGQEGIRGLPPELLAHIFTYVALPPNAALIAVTHVCRNFRAVALDHAILWSRIQVHTIPQMEAFLARSKFSLLDITVPSPSSWSPRLNDSLSMLLSRVMDRLRSFEIDVGLCDAAAVARIIANFVGRPAPHLQKLYVLDRGYTKLTRGVLPKDKQELNIFHILDGDGYRSATPSLRSLRLAPIWVPCNSGIFRGLSHLELRNMKWRVPSPTQMQLLGILRACPTLETLTLELTRIEDDGPREETESIIPLPLLSKLIMIHHSPSNFANLLSYLALPPTTRFELDTWLAHRLQGSNFCDCAIFPDRREHLPMLRALPGVELTVNLVYSRARFDLFSSTTCNEAHHVAAIFVRADTLYSIGFCIQATMVATAEQFKYRGDWHQRSFGETYRWNNTFQVAARLRTLRLVNPLEEELVDALAALSSCARERTTLVCPQLTDLELYRIPISLQTQASILDFVACRAEAGVPITRIVFGRTSVTQPAGFLEKVVELGVEVVSRPSAGEHFLMCNSRLSL